MRPPQFVIGIDGGGTKTLAIISDLKGNVLAQHVSGPTNLQIVGFERVARALLSLMRECCESVGSSLERVRAITIGLAGAGRPVDQKKMAAALQKLLASKKIRLRKVRIESDARVALEGAFKGSAGIILIAGTGSIAFGKDEQGRIHRAGGWGRILGDEGSGYFIGRQALIAVCRQMDGRSDATSLTALIAKNFGLKKPEDIIAAVYSRNLDCSAIAPFVMEAANHGDAAAIEIIQMSSLALTEHVRALVRKFSRGEMQVVRRKIPLSFIGGLISTETPLRLVLSRQIALALPEVEIVPPMAPPAYGAVVMALR